MYGLSGICLLSAAIIVLGIFMVRKLDWCWKLKHALDTEGESRRSTIWRP
ncbi:MAG: hypothetical protein ACLT5P_06810 [Flavonifractor plautii]